MSHIPYSSPSFSDEITPLYALYVRVRTVAWDGRVGPGN